VIKAADSGAGSSRLGGQRQSVNVPAVWMLVHQVARAGRAGMTIAPLMRADEPLHARGSNYFVATTLSRQSSLLI
jgi:hypothetical protein